MSDRGGKKIMVSVKEVFVAGGIPDITYVERARLGLEIKLKGAINEGHQIICVTGPTKSGKSVLCNRVLNDRKSIWLHCGQVATMDEFWEIAAEKLDLSREETHSTSGGVTIGWNYFGKLDGQIGKSDSKKSFSSAKLGVLAACKDNNICLVVDDFHYLSEENQKQVIRSVKSEIFLGLDVILIAVPHRAFDAISVEPEMQGRFVHISIPSWEIDELFEISRRGFSSLKMDVPKPIQEEFAKQAFGSPILMQRFCNKLCSHFEISEVLTHSKQFNPSDEVREGIYRDVAQNFGFPIYRILSGGPQSRTDRSKRKLRSNPAEVDIYEAVLKAVRKAGPKAETTYNEIRDGLRTILVDTDVPQKQQVTNTLRYMTREAKGKLPGEPPIEWKDDVLYITDPSLLFFLKWTKE
ncbi:MAG TPA: AAA family ATPase [Paracoccaceae bacterium]|nr:AAA family ATPase [Paracoccaceae bacterium]